MFAYGNFRSFVIKSIFGLFFLILSFFLFGSLISNNSSDPGLGVISNSDKIFNWFGAAGAYSSSILLTIFDYSAYLLILFSFVLGSKLLLGLKNHFILIKFFLILLGIIFLNLSLSMIGLNSGIIGSIMNKILYEYFSQNI